MHGAGGGHHHRLPFMTKGQGWQDQGPGDATAASTSLHLGCCPGSAVLSCPLLPGAHGQRLQGSEKSRGPGLEAAAPRSSSSWRGGSGDGAVMDDQALGPAAHAARLRAAMNAVWCTMSCRLQPIPTAALQGRTGPGPPSARQGQVIGGAGLALRPPANQTTTGEGEGADGRTCPKPQVGSRAA